jgi:hypothetical protein
MPLPSAPFDAAKSLYAGRSIIQLKLSPAVTGVTGATDTLTFLAAHGLTVGQQIQFNSGTGFTGLAAGTSYFVVAVPSTTTMKVSSTAGGSAIAVGTSSAGSFTPVLVFESRKLDHKDNREFKTIERPDSNGVNRVVRKICIKGAEEFIYELDEGKRLVTEIFSGALSGIKEGTATIWEPDPSDATGKVALKSDTDFACDVTRDGDLKFGDGDATKAQIKLSSRKQGDVIFTADAAA